MADTQESKFLRIARAAVARGLKVVPLKGKAPFLPGWKALASSDEAQLAAWAKEHPDANAGAVTGESYWVVDVDDIEWFLDRCPASFPKTLIVRTGSGKYHFYFKGPLPVGLQAVLNPQWDKTKTKDQQRGVSEKLLEFPDQVVTLGSIHPETGRAYEVRSDNPIAECPKEWLEWLRSLQHAKAGSSKLRKNSMRDGADLQKALDAVGLKYDRRDRDGNAYFNYHTKMGKCLVKGSLHEGGNNARNNECCAFVLNLSTNEVWHTCFAGGCQKGPGATRTAFAAIGIDIDDLIRPWWRDEFESFDEMTDKELEHVLARMLPLDGVTGIGAFSNEGKTWIMLSMAKAIASGERWLGFFDVKKFPVLYLIPEAGGLSVKKRMKQLDIRLGEDFLLRTRSKGQTLALTNKAILAGAKGRVVFMDTFVRWLDGRDEKDATQIAQLNDDIMDLLRAGAVAVVVAYHSPKSDKDKSGDRMKRVMTPDNMFRGSGDVYALLDSALGIMQLDWKTKEKTLLQIEQLKPRDFEPWPPFQIQGKPYIDQQGDFVLVKEPGKCGYLAEEIEDQVASDPAVAVVREFLRKKAKATVEETMEVLSKGGFPHSSAQAKRYRAAARAKPERDESPREQEDFDFVGNAEEDM
jgi:hypothetical protein